MGQKQQAAAGSIVFLELSPEKVLETYSKRVLENVFEGDERVFEKAFEEASTEQFLELLDAVFEAAGEAACKASEQDLGHEIREELFDAMIGVMKQWLGEYKSEDEDIVHEAFQV